MICWREICSADAGDVKAPTYAELYSGDWTHRSIESSAPTKRPTQTPSMMVASAATSRRRARITCLLTTASKPRHGERSGVRRSPRAWPSQSQTVRPCGASASSLSARCCWTLVVMRAPIELGTVPGTDVNSLTGAKCRSPQMWGARGAITGPGPLRHSLADTCAAAGEFSRDWPPSRHGSSAGPYRDFPWPMASGHSSRPRRPCSGVQAARRALLVEAVPQPAADGP
jgi:hypothetical protein